MKKILIIWVLVLEIILCVLLCGYVVIGVHATDRAIKNECVCDSKTKTKINSEIEIEKSVLDSHLEIIKTECDFPYIDYSAVIDFYEVGNWYCYYICVDGDCYVITLKNNSVDICVQLN